MEQHPPPKDHSPCRMTFFRRLTRCSRRRPVRGWSSEFIATVRVDAVHHGGLCLGQRLPRWRSMGAGCGHDALSRQTHRQGARLADARHRRSWGARRCSGATASSSRLPPRSARRYWRSPTTARWIREGTAAGGRCCCATSRRRCCPHASSRSLRSRARDP